MPPTIEGVFDQAVMLMVQYIEAKKLQDAYPCPENEDRVSVCRAHVISTVQAFIKMTIQEGLED